MRAELVVHVLEGKTSDGRLIYACGRKVKDRKGGPPTHVGRALIIANRREAAEAVTCEGCRRKWWHYCCDARPVDVPVDAPKWKPPPASSLTIVADLLAKLSKDLDAQQKLASFVVKWLPTSGGNPAHSPAGPRQPAPDQGPEESGTSSLNTVGPRDEGEAATPTPSATLDAYGLPNDLHAAKEEIHDWRSAFEACGVIGGPDSLRKWGVEKEAHHREHHEREDDCRDLLARALVSLGCTDEHGRHADGDIVSDAECVRQLAEKRAGLSSGPAPSELFPLAVRIEKGRQKYPTGCTLLSLLDEAGEVAHAVNKRESNDRVRDELLDVAAVAMRLYFGEIDTAWQPDFGAAPKGGVSDG